MENRTRRVKQKTIGNRVACLCLFNLAILGLLFASNGSVGPSVNVVLPPSPPIITGGLENSVFSQEDSILIQGEVHLPKALVTIFILSPHPMAVTATSDDQGRFSYLLTQPLEPGEHEVWATVTNDKEITSKKSEVATFAIGGEVVSAAKSESINGPLISLFSKSKSIWDHLVIQITILCLLFVIIGFNIYFIFKYLRCKSQNIETN